MSREGRDLQRWGEDGSRLCSGCVPLFNGRVALITNRSDMTKWGLPKGGWELDEPYAATAAERESYEEAGVKGIIGAELHQKAEYMAKSKKNAIRVRWFVLYVTDLLEEWPESSQRRRCVVDISEAIALVKKPEHRQALEEVQQRGLALPRIPAIHEKESKSFRFVLTEIQARVRKLSIFFTIGVALVSISHLAYNLFDGAYSTWEVTKDGARKLKPR